MVVCKETISMQTISLPKARKGSCSQISLAPQEYRRSIEGVPQENPLFGRRTPFLFPQGVPSVRNTLCKEYPFPFSLRALCQPPRMLFGSDIISKANLIYN